MSYGTKHTTVDGVKKIGSNLFGTCSTGAGTAAKVVALDGFDVLVEGVTIHVKFDYSNYVGNCTLKVGSTEARPLRKNGSSYGEWESGSIVSFTYDGTNWCQNDFYDTVGYSNTYSLGQSGTNITLYENGSSKNTVSWGYTSLYTRTWSKNFTIGAKDHGGIIDNSWDAYDSGGVPIGVVGFNVSDLSSDLGACWHISVWNVSMHEHSSGMSRYIHAQLTNRDSASHTFNFKVTVLYASYP